MTALPSPNSAHTPETQVPASPHPHLAPMPGLCQCSASCLVSPSSHSAGAPSPLCLGQASLLCPVPLPLPGHCYQVRAPVLPATVWHRLAVLHHVPARAQGWPRGALETCKMKAGVGGSWAMGQVGEAERGAALQSPWDLFRTLLAPLLPRTACGWV